jgi:hypothetical protein
VRPNLAPAQQFQEFIVRHLVTGITAILAAATFGAAAIAQIGAEPAPREIPESKPAAAIPGEESYEPFPGGIVDALYTTAYVVAPGGALEAVDLKTGKKLWASAAAAYPLLIDDDRIYALSPTSPNSDDHPALKILALSIKGQGKCIFQSKPIAVDEWVAGEPAGKNFSTAAKLDNGTLQLSWSVSVTAQPAGGRMPIRARIRPLIGTASPQSAAGNVKLDVATGNVESVKDAKPLVTANRSTVSAFDGREYKVVVDAEKATATLTCVDFKTKKALWEYAIEPGAVNAAKTEAAPPAGVPGGGVPMPYMRE